MGKQEFENEKNKIIDKLSFWQAKVEEKLPEEKEDLDELFWFIRKFLSTTQYAW